MSAATQALLDTSVVIALELDEPLELPDHVAEATISVVTLCGLHRGVLAARPERRATRLAVLSYAERTFEALPIDERVVPQYGRMPTKPRARDATRAATSPSC